MEVDVEENYEAASKIEESSIQKWKWLQTPDTQRRIDLKQKWKERLRLSCLFEKKEENQFLCKLEGCKDDETCWNEEKLFQHCYQVHGFWNNVEF